jgi:glycosyltransferase involved in cell wall biosynthesis
MFKNFLVKKVLIITTHPIQYNVPLFIELAKTLGNNLMVFYTYSQSKDNRVFDRGFNQFRSWDVPLNEGYQHDFIHNISPNPNTYSFFGIINPKIFVKIKQFSPDVVIVYGWNFFTHILVGIFLNKKVKLYFRGDSNLLNETNSVSAKRMLRRFVLCIVYSFFRSAFYVGERNKEYFVKHGIEENRLIFAPHSVDIGRFSFGNKDLVRSIFGIPKGDCLILFAGKLEPIKNVGLLLEAFSTLKLANIHLLIVGNGILEHELKQEFSKLSNLYFLPFQNQSEMPNIYAASDIFVLPSFSETWGLSVNEAMCAQNAIIVSDTCGCAVDLIEEGKNGYVFSSNNINDLIEKLRLTIPNVKSFGEYSREKISSWSIENTARLILNEIIK